MEETNDIVSLDGYMLKDKKAREDLETLQTQVNNLSIPTKTSDLDNDSGYITNTVNDLTNYTKTSDLNIYSKTETICGKWWNDKPIYRKVVELDLNLSSTGIHRADIGLTDVDEVVNCYFIQHSTYYDNAYNSAIASWGIQISSNIPSELYNFFINTIVNWDSSVLFTVVVEYTKNSL